MPIFDPHFLMYSDKLILLFSYTVSVAVVITFFICWAPFHAQRLVAMHMEPIDDPQSSLAVKIYDIVTYISAILFYLSTSVNPILYHTMSHKFRDAFKVSTYVRFVFIFQFFSYKLGRCKIILRVFFERYNDVIWG